MTVVAGILVLALLLVVIWVFSMNASQRRRSLLELLAAAFESGRARVDRGSFVARRDGLAFEYRFVDRGPGSTRDPWTEVDVEIPAEYPLELRIVPGKPSPEELHAGEAIDIEVGAQPFDDLFIVEAAPSDIVQQLLDEPARALLLALKAELTTHRSAEQVVLRLAVSGWLEEVAHATPLVDGVTRIASRIRDAYAAANARVPQGDIGSPYRPQVDDQPMRDAEARREAELAQLATVKQRREERQRVSSMLLIVGLIASFAVTLALVAATR